tara:strand:- start:2704 stop:3729 length:1026 start_codon:yes stop_codon:yes gene_type:complete
MDSKYNIIIRCDIGQNAGMGHYVRCNLIKKAFERRGVSTSFVVRLQGHVPDRVSLCHDQTITCNFSEELEEYQDENMVFVLDLLNKENSSHKDLALYIRELSSKTKSKLFLIEGLGSDSCPEYLYPYIDGLFTPYLQFQEAKTKNHVGGLEYVLIDIDKILQEKQIIPKAKHVLITFGGSDIWKQNQQLLSHLSNESIECSYKVVVGPLVGSKDKQLLESYCQYLDLDIVHNPSHIKDLFDWADIVITNTGQTRYELAASGIPFIIIPFDESGYDNSLIFRDLGIAYLLSPNSIGDDFRTEFKNLLEDQEARFKMSEKGREFCFNLKGADNIVSKIFEVIN